jgi:hypothetical protein
VKQSIDPGDASVGIDTLADLVDPQNGLVADLGIFIVDLHKPIASELPDLRSPSGVVVAACWITSRLSRRISLRVT